MKWIKNFYFPKPILEFLKKPIFNIHPSIDYWLILHFISGMILHNLLGAGKQSLVILILIGYEFFECYLFDKRLAIREPFMNQVLDVIVGYWGYIL